MTMKNVHVIPTDKPSRLHLGNSGLVLCDLYYSSNTINSQHIYITNSEEIKGGVWCLDIKRNIIFQSKRNEIGTSKKIPIIICAYEGCYIQKDCKKIILTTDPQLIAGGVQAIDDTFLEWFIKNPSCERVEVGYGFIRLTETDNKGYWISTPDTEFNMQIEEPKLVNNCFKCGLDLVIRDTSVPVCTDIDCRGIILSNETLREWTLQRERQKQHLIDIMKGDEELGLYDEEPKQEPTLEEAADLWSIDLNNVHPADSYIAKTGFIAGAKWQQEKMYSEEDMVNFALFLEIHLPMKPRKTHRQLLEQYKKK